MTDKATGPFTVSKELTFDSGMAEIVDATGAPFAYVAMSDCVGKDKTAAKARATRIAEALNAREIPLTAGTEWQIELIDGALDAGWKIEQVKMHVHLGGVVTFSRTISIPPSPPFRMDSPPTIETITRDWSCTLEAASYAEVKMREGMKP